MPTLTIMRGLPASGKTTEARKLVERGAVRINKDDLRAMMHNQWTRKNEKDTIRARDMIIRGLISDGKDIVVDDTNFAPEHIETIQGIVDSFNELLEDKYKVVIRDIDTPLEECIRRDANRTGKAHVGKRVIVGMYQKYLAIKKPLKSLQEGLKYAIMVDIDGTLAEKGDRDIYDGSKVYLDTVIKPVAGLVSHMHNVGDVVIIMSGRDAEYKEVTERWLRDNNIPYDHIYMRPAGDRRQDWIVKKELYDEHINGKYNVRFVIDDRKQVKRMWVEEGLFVLDVNQTDEEF